MRVAWLCIFMYSLVLCSVTENKERSKRHQSGRLKLWHKTQSRLSTHRKKHIAKKNQLGKSYNYIKKISISIYNSWLKYRLFSRGYRRFFSKRSKDEPTFQNCFYDHLSLCTLYGLELACVGMKLLYKCVNLQLSHNWTDLKYHSGIFNNRRLPNQLSYFVWLRKLAG